MVWTNRATEVSVHSGAIGLSIAVSIIQCLSKQVQYIIGIVVLIIIVIELMLSWREPCAGVHLRCRAVDLPAFQDVTCA